MTITASQAFEMLGIRPATLRKWVQRGYVHKTGRDAYVAKEVWDRWCAHVERTEARKSDPQHPGV